SYADETPAPMGRSAEHIADFAPAEPAVTRIDFAERLVTVVENQGLARVVVQRSGDRREPATFSWWIVGDTATPGEDYANLQRRTERLGADAAELTLLIPLVDDVLPEPRESFYVYLAAP